MSGESKADRPLISVIVPVYNVERYLRECLESLVHQTYDNYELLLVDDGSTDGSPAILAEYGERYEHVRVLTKPNGGLSDARNYGVARAAGDYVAFVDSDDYVSEEYLTYLAHLMFDLGGEIAVARHGREAFDPASALKCGAETLLETADALSEMMDPHGFGVSACAKLFPKALITEYPFPKGKLFEDLAVMYKIIGSCRKIARGKTQIYHYRVTPGAITRQKMREAHFDGLEAAKAERAYIDENYPSASGMARYRVVLIMIQYMELLQDGSRESRQFFKRIQKEMRQVYREAMRDPAIVRGTKIRMTAVMAGYGAMRLLWKAAPRHKA